MAEHILMITTEASGEVTPAHLVDNETTKRHDDETAGTEEAER